MHIISKSALRRFWEVHADAKASLMGWYKIARKAEWKTPAEVRDSSCHAVDFVKNFTVFNVCGNKYRLITFIDYETGKVFIRDVITHKEYDTDKWKSDSWYE